MSRNLRRSRIFSYPVNNSFPQSFDFIHIGQTVGRVPASGTALSLHHIELDPSAAYVVATQVLIDKENNVSNLKAECSQT